MAENSLLKHFDEFGYCVLDSGLANTDSISALFESKYKSKFCADIKFNRNLLKCFANEPIIRRIFLEGKLFDMLRVLNIKHPLYTGPIVTHYTSLDQTGGGYGLDLHQDWPSMATSDKGVICWTSLFDTTLDTHGITVVPGSHKQGCLPGMQTDMGYVVEEKYLDKRKNLEVKKGSFLFMHPWLVHATYVNEQCDANSYKLSISTRFDDFECHQWKKRGFRNAYVGSVDREMWTKAN